MSSRSDMDPPLRPHRSSLRADDASYATLGAAPRHALVPTQWNLPDHFCDGLAYRSSRRSKSNRPIDRAWDLRARFGAEDEDDYGGLFEPPAKPKGMHSRTYDRLCAQLGDAEGRSWDELLSSAWARRHLASVRYR